MPDVASPDATGLSLVAYSQDGYFTVAQAREHGFSAQLLAHHLRSGRYERERRGLYRLAGYPGSPLAGVRALWLAVGAGRAVVSHESAVELHGLADVAPNAVHLTVGREHRGIKPPAGVRLHTRSGPWRRADVVEVEGIRVTSPARSIADAASAGTQPDQIDLAVSQALERGIVTPATLRGELARQPARVRDLLAAAIDQA